MPVVEDELLPLVAHQVDERVREARPDLRLGDGCELAVEPRHGGESDVEMEIGRTALDEHLEHVVEVHRGQAYARTLEPCR